jgi:CDP-diacylglycerol--glycerol-3-phosphate 3-phosphatidyltransferase
MMNTPNALALFRIALAPLMFWFLIGRDNSIFTGMHISWLDYFAALTFVIASVTDFFDGFIAREWDQKTILGAILDPLADKMLMLAGFLGLMFIDRADAWIVFLILTREFMITGIRVVAASENMNISASFWGKMKTFAQIMAIGFLIMDWSGGTILLWIALILTLYSGFEYMREFFKNYEGKN